MIKQNQEKLFKNNRELFYDSLYIWNITDLLIILVLFSLAFTLEGSISRNFTLRHILVPLNTKSITKA